MDRQPVKSSNLCSVGYDAENQVLEVEFASGGVYQYSGVPATVYLALMSSPSKGKYLRMRIKGKYPVERTE